MATSEPVGRSRNGARSVSSPAATPHSTPTLRSNKQPACRLPLRFARFGVQGRPDPVSVMGHGKVAMGATSRTKQGD